jgi:threonine aldolase
MPFSYLYILEDIMLSFESDYTEGAHPEILRRLIETNMVQQPGYGSDIWCESAKDKIRIAVGYKGADVHLLTGGTQTNMIVIDALLGACEGVISADTGHIQCHEAGAVESCGRKILPLPHDQGKIRADVLLKYLDKFYKDPSYTHMVYPGMVYISHPTEYGTLYSLDELRALSRVCNQYEIPLFMDGARLGYGLMSHGTDVTLKDVANLCDVFYIGGTKVGALCGEAVVFPRREAPKHFFTFIKQHGALLAKGRLLGVQFDALFTDDLYFRISRHAIEMADRIRDALSAKGYEFFLPTVTNQIFVVLNDAQLKKLTDSISCSIWEHLDDGRTVIRIATSWATTEENVNTLINLL